MEREKCQICDGPISQGRCRYCGMPYRKDELLYHLNENQEEHYRHATPRARAILDQKKAPAGGSKAPAGPSSAAKAVTSQKTAAKTRNTASERTAPQKLSDRRNALKKAQIQSRTYKAFGSSSRPQKKKKRLLFRVLLFVFVLQFLPAALNALMRSSALSRLADTITGGRRSAVATDEIGLSVGEPLWDYDSQTTYVTCTWLGREPLVVGTDIPEGPYVFILDSGDASLLITDAQGDDALLSLSEDTREPQPLFLSAGMEISLHSAEYANAFVDIRYVEEPAGSSL